MLQKTKNQKNRQGSARPVCFLYFRDALSSQTKYVVPSRPGEGKWAWSYAFFENGKTALHALTVLCCVRYGYYTKKRSFDLLTCLKTLNVLPLTPVLSAL